MIRLGVLPSVCEAKCLGSWVLNSFRTRFLIMIFLTISLVTPTSAQADNRADAERLFRAGEQAFNASQYIEAAQAFERAYEKLALPSIAFSMAQAYRLQYFVDKDARWLKRAVQLYRQYISTLKTGGRRADAVANLAELEPILGRIEARGKVEAVVVEQKTKLLVTSQVEAQVSIDGGELQPLPLAKELPAGKYKIVVQAEGYFPFREDREVFEGQFRVVEVVLKPKPAVVAIQAESGAAISIDGRPVGATPLKPVEVSEGRHFMTISRRGRLAYSREFVAKRGEAISIEASLAMSGQRKAALVTMGGSGLLFLVGGGFALAALRADTDASDILKQADQGGGLTPSQLGSYEEARTHRNDRLTTVYGVLGAATVTTVVGVLLFYMDSPEPESPEPGSLTLLPVVGATTGMVMSGQF